MPTSPTPAELIAQLPQGLGARAAWARAWGATFQFQVTGDGGGEWTVDLSQPESPVRPGLHAPARATVICSAADFVALVQRAWTPQQAFTAGRLSVKGDLGLGLRFPDLFA